MIVKVRSDSELGFSEEIALSIGGKVENGLLIDKRHRHRRR
jgi:hypothetical protein